MKNRRRKFSLPVHSTPASASCKRTLEPSSCSSPRFPRLNRFFGRSFSGLLCCASSSDDETNYCYTVTTADNDLVEMNSATQQNIFADSSPVALELLDSKICAKNILPDLVLQDDDGDDMDVFSRTNLCFADENTSPMFCEMRESSSSAEYPLATQQQVAVTDISPVANEIAFIDSNSNAAQSVPNVALQDDDGDDDLEILSRAMSCSVHHVKRESASSAEDPLAAQQQDAIADSSPVAFNGDFISSYSSVEHIQLGLLLPYVDDDVDDGDDDVEVLSRTNSCSEIQERRESASSAEDPLATEKPNTVAATSPVAFDLESLGSFSSAEIIFLDPVLQDDDDDYDDKDDDVVALNGTNLCSNAENVFNERKESASSAEDPLDSQQIDAVTDSSQRTVDVENLVSSTCVDCLYELRQLENLENQMNVKLQEGLTLRKQLEERCQLEPSFLEVSQLDPEPYAFLLQDLNRCQMDPAIIKLTQDVLTQRQRDKNLDVLGLLNLDGHNPLHGMLQCLLSLFPFQEALQHDFCKENISLFRLLSDLHLMRSVGITDPTLKIGFLFILKSYLAEKKIEYLDSNTQTATMLLHVLLCMLKGESRTIRNLQPTFKCPAASLDINVMRMYACRRCKAKKKVLAIVHNLNLIVHNGSLVTSIHVKSRANRVCKQCGGVDICCRVKLLTLPQILVLKVECSTSTYVKNCELMRLQEPLTVTEELSLTTELKRSLFSNVWTKLRKKHVNTESAKPKYKLVAILTRLCTMMEPISYIRDPCQDRWLFCKGIVVREAIKEVMLTNAGETGSLLFYQRRESSSSAEDSAQQQVADCYPCGGLQDILV